jgi:hypothetical protein
MRWLAVIIAALALSACAPQVEPEGGVNLDGEPECTYFSNGKPACGGADL